MFNYLNSILYKSNKESVNLLSLSEDNTFQPYLIQRWCTMHSTAVTTICNETSNRYWTILESSKDWYMLLNTTIPKCSFKRITYHKKTKNEANAKEKEYIQKIANSLEISSRELISYIKDSNLKINLPKTND